jgi:hypothetical protein
VADAVSAAISNPSSDTSSQTRMEGEPQRPKQLGEYPNADTRGSTY